MNASFSYCRREQLTAAPSNRRTYENKRFSKISDVQDTTKAL